MVTARCSYELCCQSIFDSVACVMQLESKTHISPLLTKESPVAQWLEHPIRSRGVVVSNPISDLGLGFFRLPNGFNCKKNMVNFLVFSDFIRTLKITGCQTN